MTIKWKTTTPKVPPKRSAELRFSDIYLSCDEKFDDHRVWKYVSLTFGHHTTDPLEQCVRDWPREAIAEARAKLDALESELDNSGSLEELDKEA